MPYKITLEKHGSLTKWWGDASTSEMIHVQEQVQANPNFDYMHYSIHDFSECDHLALTQEEVEFTAGLDSAASLTNSSLKIALVGANTEVLAAANAYMDVELSPYPLRIFSSMEEARAWVIQRH